MLSLEPTTIIVGAHAPLPPRGETLERSGLTVRSMNILEDLGYSTVEDVLAMTADDLERVKTHRWGNLDMMRQVAMLICRRTGRNPFDGKPWIGRE